MSNIAAKEKALKEFFKAPKQIKKSLNPLISSVVILNAYDLKKKWKVKNLYPFRQKDFKENKNRILNNNNPILVLSHSKI